MLKWRRTHVTKTFLCTLLIFVGCVSHAQTMDTNSDKISFKLSCNEAQFFDLLNVYRRSRGLNTLEVSKAGVIAARWHVNDMIQRNYFAHTEPDGRTFRQRAENFGYPSRAENIAAGNKQATKTFCQWRNSPGHNANMLGRYQSTGIGLALNLRTNNFGAFWSNGFSNTVGDEISEPMTDDADCMRLTALPKCPVKL